MTDLILAIILLVIVFLAVGYIVKTKKNGGGCIGCPNAAKCGKTCHCQQKP